MPTSKNSKTALITGAASGFGKALAHRLSKQSYNLVLADISILNYSLPNTIFLKTNVLNKQELINLFNAGIKKFGYIDAVFNNAGISEQATFGEATDSWKKVIDIDLTAVILGTRLSLEYMTRGGVVVNTSSLAGLYPQNFQPVYAAAKSGVVHFTKSVAISQSFLDLGVRVNCICPSFVDTGILDSFDETVKSGLDLVDIEVVVDAFLKALEPGYNGAVFRVTKMYGVDLYQVRRSKI